MKIIFVLQNLSSGSAYMRGILPTIGLRLSGLEADYVVAESFNPAKVNNSDIVVFVKYDNYNQSIVAKESGAKVFLDVVDSKKHWKRHKEHLDGLIVNTKSQIEIMKNIDKFDKPIIKIPHIMTNFLSNYEGQVRKQIPKEIKTIGYLGVSKTFTDMFLFEQFCKDSKLEWYVDQPSINTNQNSTLKLDLGCIHYLGDTERVGGTISISKPSGKLINMFSYGIPVLFTPYESYLDEIGNSEFSGLLWCCCNTAAAMFDKVNILRNNWDFYKELSDEAYEFSKKYHVSNAPGLYSEITKFIR